MLYSLPFLRDNSDNDMTEFLLHKLLPALVTMTVAILVGRWLRFLMRRISHKVLDIDTSIERFFEECAAWSAYITGLISSLSFLGVNTTGILAAISAAGLAIGLALRDTLGNVAAGLQLLFLRPISTGDFLQCGNLTGTVEEIGLFSTRLRTPDGLFVSAPNSVLCNAPLTNFSRNPSRRLDIAVGISYGDSIDAGIKALLAVAAAESRLLGDPAPQAFAQALDESSVSLVLRVWVPRDAYWDVRFALVQAAKQAVEAAGLTIPFPQRDVHLVPPPGSGPVAEPSAR